MVKGAAAFLFGPTRRHFQAWWPHLKLKRWGVSPEILYRGVRVGTLVTHHHLRRPEAIYVIGSGPSVLEQNLSLIPDNSSILLNGAISLLGDVIKRPLAVAIEDERFVWRHFKMMQERILEQTPCFLSPAVIRAICERNAEWLRAHPVILIDDLRKPYLRRRTNDAHLKRRRFVSFSDDQAGALSLAPAWGVIQGGSVVVSAIQFAIALAPAHIGLIGIDITNSNEPRFYELAGDAAKSGLLKARQRIIEHLVLAKKICDERAIAVSIHSSKSALLQAGFAYDASFELARKDLES
ncbi:putative glycosyltransferase protein [Hyphomicrobium denitrificans 1NES1]|uniref:Putative glycosyltransferase protein n=1 Tax=Hyphomicrobium denitrificans 1NES1 TaxID=670307 RepID=N0B8I6_9HYPH|nr:putative glycosyltransferase protein [Hyphomicrobium denitrificans 1NES1]